MVDNSLNVFTRAQLEYGTNEFWSKPRKITAVPVVTLNRSMTVSAFKWYPHAHREQHTNLIEFRFGDEKVHVQPMNCVTGECGCEFQTILSHKDYLNFGQSNKERNSKSEFL